MNHELVKWMLEWTRCRCKCDKRSLLCWNDGITKGIKIWTKLTWHSIYSLFVNAFCRMKQPQKLLNPNSDEKHLEKLLLCLQKTPSKSFAETQASVRLFSITKTTLKCISFHATRINPSTLSGLQTWGGRCRDTRKGVKDKALENLKDVLLLG